MGQPERMVSPPQDGGLDRGGLFSAWHPSKVEGNTYTWTEGKVDFVPFTATIENGALKSVNCL